MDLTGAQAQLLRDQVQRASQEFGDAQHEYEQALALALELQFSSDGALSLRRANERYRTATAAYNAAIRNMADFILKR